MAKQEEQQAFRPAAVRELFDEKSDMTSKTETPSKMILRLVGIKIVEEAINPKRKKGLLTIFREEFDRRMISKERKGRLELLAAMQSQQAGEDEEEGQL